MPPRKRKAPSSKQSNEPKPKIIREEEKEEKEEAIAEDVEVEEEDGEEGKEVEETIGEDVEEEEDGEEEKKVEETIDEDVEEEEEEDDKETSDEEESSSEEEEEESGSESEDEDDNEDEDEDEEEEEPNDEASKRETLRELVEPFGKSQIIDILKEAISKDPKILSEIIQKVDADPTHRKIFIYGLGWDATSEQLVETFKSFGEIEESKLITDKNTGRAKGYAFVMFKTRAAAREALKVPQKRIGSKTVTCQLAAMGPPGGTGAADGGSRKMYVAKVGPHVSSEKLRAFFGSFGEIEEGPLGMDPGTNKFKGFAIITYKSTEGFKKAMEEPIKVFENCQLHCKKFMENYKRNASGQGSVSSANPAVSDVSYGSLGMNTGILGSNLNASGLLMGQNPGMGMGLPGNAMLAAGYNPAGYNPTGYNPGLATPMAGMSGNYGMNNISTGVIGNYGTQAALHGFGAFNNAQAGLSSVGTMGTATSATRAPTSGASASTTYPSYNYR